MAFVGLMGVGKSTIGMRLAKKMGMPFFDSDQEVERSSGGHSVSDIYDQWGESAFRDAEYLVMKRLLDEKKACIISTGEGAFIEPRTRALLQDRAITIWLKSDLSTLAERVQRKTRPQFSEGNVEEILEGFIKDRYPIYKFADICVESNDEFYQDTVDRILAALKDFLYPST